ncbi:cupin domain-containing protein [Glaciecola siphonariae]|uniref:Cupin domain-containing protein n=1 Tax=Glaciecola siphonariae TaxID=521012 RepID=A0ABV9LZH2_9ALTE
MNKAPSALHMQGFDIDYFVQHFWQKKPCVIKGFFDDFTDPLDEHELAGLAQEDSVDSRLISFNDNAWQVTQGPIDDFAPLCVGAWSLLVQGVDRYMPEVGALSDKVKRLGHWRMDDVMVSFSSPGAGVGPHIDQYDVFIVQGKGSRRWQVGLPNAHENLTPHPLLKQISEFTPTIDEVLEPGDAVYIPPKHPHNGVALTECLNYSIGFRAPTNLELLHGLLDEGEDLQLVQRRYEDPDNSQYRDAHMPPAQVSQHELARLKALIAELLNTPEADQALMRFISAQSLPDMKPDEEYTIEEVLDACRQGLVIKLLPGVKAVYSHVSESPNEPFVFYVDAQPFSTTAENQALMLALIHTGELSISADVNYGRDNKTQTAFAALVSQLVNAGFVYFDA